MAKMWGHGGKVDVLVLPIYVSRSISDKALCSGSLGLPREIAPLCLRHVVSTGSFGAFSERVSPLAPSFPGGEASRKRTIS